jgi:hypothetical protein
MFGRSSKPESHYLFNCPGIKTTQFTDGSRMLIEIRSTSGYTMFPGSIDPSGEPIEWSHRRLAMTIAEDDALGHANLSMTSAYLRSRTDSLDEAYAQLERHQARKRVKVVKGNGPRLAHDDQDVSVGSLS